MRLIIGLVFTILSVSSLTDVGPEHASVYAILAAGWIIAGSAGTVIRVTQVKP